MRNNDELPTTKRLLLKARQRLQVKRNDASTTIWAMLAIACLVALGSSGCGRQTSSADAETPAAAQTTSSQTPSLFTVAPSQMSHIQVEPAQITRLPQVLRLTGSVAYNAFETTPVITQVSGPVTRVLVYPGEMVRAGQPLLEVSSPDYAQSRSNYLKASDALSLAERTYARSKDLYSHHAIATQDLEQAESARNQAEADFNAAWQALKVLGFSTAQQVLQDPVSPEIPLLAPLSGEVVERLVSPGQVVQGGSTQCFTISNLSTVWVLANVYQHDLACVHMGDLVEIETDAYPMVFHGRVSYIAPALDPVSRTLQVRINTQNPGQKLKKDMYVTVILNAGAISRALTVPDAAVLRNSENQPFVYVEASQRQFAERLVNVGSSENGRTQILSGLQSGEPVVADGSLFLQFANSFQH